MIKTKKFKTPLFGNKFTLIVYENPIELREHLSEYDFDRNNIDNFDGCVFTYKDKKYITFKRFVEDGVQYPTAGIIAHESKHLTNNIFIDIGQHLDAWNDEAECYLLQWIVNRVHEFITNNYNEPNDVLTDMKSLLNYLQYFDSKQELRSEKIERAKLIRKITEMIEP